MEPSLKPRLPDGWTVKLSKTYKGKVYYFNERTGAAVWNLEELMDLPASVKKQMPVSSERSNVGCSRVGTNGGLRKRSPVSSSEDAKCLKQPERKYKVESSPVKEEREQYVGKRKWDREEGCRSSTAREESADRKSRRFSLKRPKFSSPSGTFSPASTDSGHSTLGSETSLSKTTSVSSAGIQIKTESQAGVVPIDLDFSEAMEVDEVDDEEMLVDIQEVREKLREEPHTVCGELSRLTSTHSSLGLTCVLNVICIVLDTNTLLSDLKIIQMLPLTFQGMPFALKFLVPWVVLQELDALKAERYYRNKNPTICKRAQLAIKFIHEQLSASGKSHFHGQTLAEARDLDAFPFLPENLGGQLISNDDRILAYCLSCAKNHKVILFTNDVNLRNKAIVHNVDAKGREGIEDGISLVISKLSPATSQSQVVQTCHQVAKDINLVEKVKHELANCLREVLTPIMEVEMQAAFPDNWLKIVLKKPPWTLEDLILCLEKHFIAVFGFFLKKSSNDDIRELKNFFIKKRGHRVSVKELTTIFDTSIRLLTCFQLRSDYNGAVTKAFNILTTLYSECDDVSSSEASGIRRPSSDLTYSAWNDRRCDGPSSSRSLPDETSTSYSTYSARTPPLPSSKMRVSKPLPAEELPPPELCEPVPDFHNAVLSESIDRAIKDMFFSVWFNVNHFCGILCDHFGYSHTLEYVKPETAPSENECQNFVPRLFPVVCRLTKDTRGVLEIGSNDPRFEQPCGMLRESLMNFHESLDMADERTWEVPSLKAFCAYCSIDDNRKALRDGLWKMTEIRGLLQRIVLNNKPQTVIID